MLQVVPSEFPVRQAEQPPQLPLIPPANQIVRVGDVLQVVPTTVIDWAPGVQQSPVSVVTTPIRFPPPPLGTPSSTPSPAIASPLQQIAIAQLPPTVKSMMPIITSPQVASSPAVVFPAPKPPPPEPVIQPVYNYEAIMEARRVEREERKRQREMKHKEKERRLIERAKRRADRFLNKSKAKPSTSASITTVYKTPSVNAELNAIITSEMNKSMELEEMQSSMTSEESEVTVGTPHVNAVVNNDEGYNEDEEEEQEEEQIQPKSEENEVENEEPAPTDGNGSATVVVKLEDMKPIIIPPPPAKGILILPGFM